MAFDNNGLTEKMKSFCRAYIANGGNGMEAYRTAYNSSGNDNTVSVEAMRLLKREDIRLYLNTLTAPMETKALSEREKIKKILWGRLEKAIAEDNDILAIKITDQINRMNAEYININRTEATENININNIDIDTLKRLSDDL